ncbi:GGDEF domain-containing protein [Rhizobium sp. LjRoot254]|uniref:GGDEF domain-containing protein n=1 Tax=Rhizobium sp. LjRoot254 TaxID=3342297 RepID=UPI003ECF0A15
MVAQIKNWIIRRIAVGAFSKRRDVLRFALTRSFWTTIAAVGLNFGVYQLFGRLGFLNVTLPPDPWADTVVTAFVAGPICFLAYYLIGKAIRDLSVSRDAFERLSRTDPLTGLMNRRAFVDVISALNAPYVVAILDIDRFKVINDTYGHAAGDAVLVEVARELRRVLGRDAAVARLGGEEFGVILRDRAKDETIAVMDLVRAALATRTFDVDGSEISVTFSAGVSRGDGKTGYSILLTHADKALYLAKASGRNRVVHSDDILAFVSSADSDAGKIAV